MAAVGGSSFFHIIYQTLYVSITAGVAGCGQGFMLAVVHQLERVREVRCVHLTRNGGKRRSERSRRTLVELHIIEDSVSLCGRQLEEAARCDILPIKFNF